MIDNVESVTPIHVLLGLFYESNPIDQSLCYLMPSILHWSEVLYMKHYFVLCDDFLRPWKVSEVLVISDHSESQYFFLSQWNYIFSQTVPCFWECPLLSMFWIFPFIRDTYLTDRFFFQANVDVAKHFQKRYFLAIFIFYFIYSCFGSQWSHNTQTVS